MSAPQCFVGIDVAKAQRDIALRPTGERWALVNDDAGIAALVARLQVLQPTLIVLEATGGYQRAVVAALCGDGPAGGGGQSPPRPGLRQSHRAVGQDGCPRCTRLSPFCRSGKAHPPALA